MTGFIRSGPKVGYTIEDISPQPIFVAGHNILVAGTTGEAGKTTAIEGMISRWPNKQFIIFRTKRGELEFPYAKRMKPYWKSPPRDQLWRYVESMIEGMLQEKNKIIRATIMRMCRNADSLSKVWANVQTSLKKSKGFELDMLTQLDEYLKIVIPKLKEQGISNTFFDLEPHNLSEYGPQDIFVMDLTRFPTDIQSMIIGAVAQEVLEYYKDIVLVIPEAWEHIPNGKKTTAKPFLEALVRKGRVLGNFIVIDSQDIVGIEPVIRKQTAVYLLGKQSESIEAENTLKELPLSKGNKPDADEVQRLSLGQFFLVTEGKCWKVFAQPKWMPDADAAKCAINPSLARIFADGRTIIQQNPELVPDSIENWKAAPPNEEEPVPFRTHLSKDEADTAEILSPVMKAMNTDDGITSIPKSDTTSVIPGDFLKVSPKPIMTDGKIEAEQARVTVIQRQVVKPDLDETTLEGRIGVLMADGFFDFGRTSGDIFRELERHYPGKQTGQDNFRKNLCGKAMRFWQSRPYGYVKKDAEVWVITDIGRKYLKKVLVEV